MRPFAILLGSILSILVHAADDGWLELSGPASPSVQMALTEADGGLRLAVRVAPDGVGAAPPAVQVGWWHGEAAIRASSDAECRTERVGEDTVYSWALPLPPDGVTPRLALAVEWALRRERCRFTDHRAPHAGFNPDPQSWEPFDLGAHFEQVTDRALRLAIPLNQPLDGKATVVIEDAAGNRVRNLAAGLAVAAGKQELTWDGLDDDGKLVALGSYRWRAIHHPGIVPEYQFTFANGDESFFEGFGTNHGVFTDLTANGQYAFAAAPLTEGGYALIALDADGRWRHGYRQIHGTGIQAVAAAADERYFYAANDGPAWGQKTDRSKPDWQMDVSITLTRFDIEAGNSVDFKAGERFARVESHAYGPGAEAEHLRRQLSLTGMALIGNRLYLGSRAAGGILVVDKATATVERTLPLAEPGALAVDGETLIAVSGRRVVRLDPATGATTELVADGELEPRGLAVDGERLLVSDGASHTVRVYALATGEAAGSYGVPGGAYEGAFVPERLVNPRGIVVFGGKLWVTEDRRNPKRLTAFDLSTGKVVVQKAGNPPYGAPGAGFDPRDPTHWLGLRAGWRLDPATGTATCISVMQQEQGHLGGRLAFCSHYRFVHLDDGRILLIGFAKATLVSELMPDGSVRDLAAIGGAHTFSYACGWNPPPEYVEAFNRAYPNKIGKHMEKGPGVLWVDLNGDGDCQVEEFQFSTAAEQFAGGYWGHAQADLTMRFPATVGGKTVIVTLQPDGFHSGGAPRYPDFNAACLAGVATSMRHPGDVTTTDRFGNLIVNGDPWMTAYAPDGRLLWRYPNRWVGVHGSHQAPLPETGVMQGNLYFLGTAPLDEQADLTMLNGNHGRFFILTTDGFYLDEMFNDVRVTRDRNEMLVGGEPFGGVFGRADDGTYYLQAGGEGYRIYILRGLDRITRSAGTLEVTPAQLVAAERHHARRAVAERAAVRDSASPVSWDRDGKFPVTASFAIEGDRLRLRYEVADDSPWVNQGKDWQLLFKTGDAVDFHFGADPTAKPTCREAVAGDKRLLIAPYDGGSIAVLYDARAPGTTTEPVQFASPWRSVAFDRVVRLESAAIEVKRQQRAYTLSVTIPLAELGLSAEVQSLRGDLGVLYGDREGAITVLRSYWANPATALVNDVPGEAMLTPNAWGTLQFHSVATGQRKLVSRGILGNANENGGALGERVLGLGVVVDREGALWDRIASDRLGRYAPDGRLLASYPLPKSNDKNDAIHLAGETLLMQLGGQLYRLAVDAPPGTAPEPVATETIPEDQRPLAFFQAPEGVSGARAQRIGDYWYSHGWHSTIYRFNQARRPDPGVVLGGNSGSFIGHVAENPEIVYGRGMAKLPDGLFAVSGELGVLHLLRWDEPRRQFDIVRRIGPLAGVKGLAIDRQGRIAVAAGVWQWSDGPDAPLTLGIPVEIAGQAVLIDDEIVVAPAYQYGNQPRLLYGTLDKELTLGRHPDFRLPKGHYACAAYQREGQRRLLVVDAKGNGQELRLGSKGEPLAVVGRPRIVGREPLGAITSLAMKNATTLLVAAGGAIVECDYRDDGWHEVRRWSDWQGDRFGPTLYVTAHSGRLWVADTERHRVLVFDLATGEPIATQVTGLDSLNEPRGIAACGNRAAVWDSGNQRLVKLELATP